MKVGRCVARFQPTISCGLSKKCDPSCVRSDSWRAVPARNESVLRDRTGRKITYSWEAMESCLMGADGRPNVPPQSAACIFNIVQTQRGSGTASLSHKGNSFQPPNFACGSEGKLVKEMSHGPFTLCRQSS